MEVQVKAQSDEMFFNMVLNTLEEWKETTLAAARVFGVDEAKLQEAIDYIESLEEEVLRLSLFF
ncbi:hypothetical protein IPA_04105 [Ignicoccus pacificus DSM 13166]|uniref:Uncharacterized protein n=1 Tax=Ignicoccus pacificus DSM 13166 TaxID=940294 RepID=A0A977PLI8_9CREN|nr:hypothetical protein IPA_04105 [Ignicoccus pacificus DSM 13166]